MDFDDLYTLVANPITPDASFDECLLETYGADHDHVLHVLNTHPDRVWTVVEGDRGEYVIAGYHVVNRIGYLITTEDVQPEHRDFEFPL
jgi:hypothetical protein